MIIPAVPESEISNAYQAFRAKWPRCAGGKQSAGSGATSLGAVAVGGEQLPGPKPS